MDLGGERDDLTAKHRPSLQLVDACHSVHSVSKTKLKGKELEVGPGRNLKNEKVTCICVENKINKGFVGDWRKSNFCSGIPAKDGSAIHSVFVLIVCLLKIFIRKI